MKVQIGQVWRFIGPYMLNDLGAFIPPIRDWMTVTAFVNGPHGFSAFLQSERGTQACMLVSAERCVLGQYWEPLQPDSGFASAEWARELIEHCSKQPADESADIDAPLPS